jgi:hypothetical protein
MYLEAFPLFILAFYFSCLYVNMERRGDVKWRSSMWMMLVVGMKIV